MHFYRFWYFNTNPYKLFLFFFLFWFLWSKITYLCVLENQIWFARFFTLNHRHRSSRFEWFNAWVLYALSIWISFEKKKRTKTLIWLIEQLVSTNRISVMSRVKWLCVFIYSLQFWFLYPVFIRFENGWWENK